MAAGTTPIFIQNPAYFIAEVSTANTNFDGTGTIVSLAQGDTDGTLIERIYAVCEGTTSADLMVNLFLSDDAGSTWNYWKSINLGTITASSTQQPAQSSLPADDLPLGLESSSMRIGCSITTSDNATVIAVGGDF